MSPAKPKVCLSDVCHNEADLCRRGGYHSLAACGAEDVCALVMGILSEWHWLWSHYLSETDNGGSLPSIAYEGTFQLSDLMCSLWLSRLMGAFSGWHCVWGHFLPGTLSFHTLHLHSPLNPFLRVGNYAIEIHRLIRSILSKYRANGINLFWELLFGGCPKQGIPSPWCP